VNVPARSALPLALALLLCPGCNGDRPGEAPPAEADPAEAPVLAESPPATPASRYDVRCERVLPESLRQRHMYGWPMAESAGADRATCTFDQEPFRRIIVAFDCRDRASSPERLDEVRRTVGAHAREQASPGRLAMVSDDGVPWIFWDDDTDCEVTVDRVGWNEPPAAGVERAHAVAAALDPASIAR
jgi:hypothetical protein